MALGTTYGGGCYATQAEAVNAWCGAFEGQGPNGIVYSCGQINTAVSGTAGGEVTFAWRRKNVDSAGASTNTNISGQWLPSCETYGFDYYSPAIAAWAAAMVAVIAAKFVWRHVFARESL